MSTSIENKKIEVLRTASDYVVKLKLGVTKAAEYFQSGENEKGINMVPYIAEGINWITQALKSTEDILCEKISFDDLNGKLNETLEAMENHDTMLIGDLFQYEVLPAIENIEKIINKSILN